METFINIIALQNRITNENVAIKQEWFHKIKWFVCLFKLIW
jgi:hypothetical protein